MKVVIVGGVAGGASAAARLRRLDEEAEIVMLERGAHISYANCGLPYYIGGEITEKSALTLQTPERFHRRFGIDVRVNQEVVSVNPTEKTVLVTDGKTGESSFVSYDKLILSPGAMPIVPPIEGVEDPRVFTLRNIPDTYRIHEYIQEQKPKTAVIIGGGYIGVEMAENLVHAGVQVTVVERSSHLIGPLDREMASDVHSYLKKKGVGIILSNGVTKFQAKEEGLHVVLEHGELDCDFVLMSVGVRPDTKFLQGSGIERNPRGQIQTNEFMQTNFPDVYAIGDAAEIRHFQTGEPGFIPLAGPANKQGRLVADHICGKIRRYTGTQGTSILKLFDMTVASTGLKEEAAKEAGLEYDKVYLWTASHATYYPGATNMQIKVIFELGTGKILGAQIVGMDGVDKRIDVLASVIRGELTGEDLTELELAYAPPFSSAKDPVNMIGFMIQNLLEEKVKQYHYHDVPDLQKREDIMMLDVRTQEEYRRGNIDGTINIPLDDLRQRLGELDPSKPIYINCQSGLRSYLASRILSQNGFTCSHLAGGYRLYQAVTQDQAADFSPTHPCGVPV